MSEKTPPWARTKTLPAWSYLPSTWILEDGLRNFIWKEGGSDNTAALMALVIIGQHADPSNGVAELTYGQIAEKGNMSRTKVSKALDLLEAQKIITRKAGGRSSFALNNFNPAVRGWAKLPAKKLYHNGVVSMFADFNLRKRAEFDAIKLYLLLLAYRENKTNMTNLSYDTIELHSGIPRVSIKPALTILAIHQLVHFEQKTSGISDFGISTAYRIAYLDPYNHAGTTGRGRDPADFADLLG